MKGKTVFVVGAGQGPTVSELALKMAGETMVEVVELKQLLDEIDSGVINQRNYFPTDFQEPIEYKLSAMPLLPEGKQFTCKGKHQYTEKDGQWICECGRNMKD